MSVRTKLFLSITALILFFVALSLLLNSLYLEKFYIWQKEASLQQTRKQIEGMYSGDPEDVAAELEAVERNSSLNINILDPLFRPKYPFRVIEIGVPRRHSELPALILSLQPKLLGLASGQYFTAMVLDARLKTQFLTLASCLTNGDFLIISSPVAAINESTAVANRFFMFTGILTIILGGTTVYYLAKRFTKPIVELNDIALKMAKLDFHQKYDVRSSDEVGQLGTSINSLSDQLDVAITDLTEANSKLKEDIERERRIDKMRKEFISNVSHEFKTPIALIQGYAEGLKLNVNENEADRDYYCEVIMDEAAKMNRLVKDLLNLSQIESGYFQIERSDFDLSIVIDKVVDKYRPILADKGATVSIDKPNHLLANGDKLRLEQVLVNYVSNAINHIAEPKLIDITVATKGEKYRVGIYNSGPPIPEESMDKLWTSFYKVDKARTRAYGGTGLGLSVVRAIMELHHNNYGVANQDGGVVFWFEADRANG